MCEIKDAQRHEELAQIYEQEKNITKAIEHYLEASSIYVLNAEVQKKDHLIKNANQCYRKVQQLRGDKNISEQREFTKQELAQKTLRELNQIALWKWLYRFL